MRTLTPLFFKTSTILGVVLFVAVSFGCVKEQPGDRGSGELKVGERSSSKAVPFMLAKLESVPEPYAEGNLVAYFDSTPVTDAELERFYMRVLGGVSESHRQGQSAIYTALPIFHRHHAVVQEALRQRLDESSFFVNSFRLTVLMALAQVYQGYYVENAPVDSQTIEGSIPSRWIKMNFALKTFPSEDGAQKAMSGISSPEEFRETQSDVKLSKREDSETGSVFPGSGFFEAWEDRELFDLEEGDIYGPVKSGVGWAIVLVKEKQVFTPSQQEEYLRDVRQKYSSNWAAEKFKEFQAERKIEVLEENVNDGIIRELTVGGYSDEPVLVIDGMVLSYRMFRLLKNDSYTRLKVGFPRSYWKNVVMADLKPLLNRMLVGMMAEKALEEGKWTPDLPPELLQMLYDYKKTLLYNAYMDSWRRKVKAGLSTDELKKYYDSNREQFRIPDRAQIVYSFSLDEKKAATWEKIVLAGGSFAEAINASPGGKDETKNFLFDEHSGQVSRSDVVRGDMIHDDLQDEIFALGDKVGVFKRETGYYLLTVENMVPSRILPFDEVRPQIADRVMNMHRSTLLDPEITELAAKVKVKMIGSLPEEDKGIKDIPYPDLG